MNLKGNLQEIYDCAASIYRNADNIDTTGQLGEDLSHVVDGLKSCIDACEVE